MTAKIPLEERQGIRHHMMDCMELLAGEEYNRNRYFWEAMGCLEGVRSRGKNAVVVGGTNYYVETLLYDVDMHNGY